MSNATAFTLIAYYWYLNRAGKAFAPANPPPRFMAPTFGTCKSVQATLPHPCSRSLPTSLQAKKKRQWRFSEGFQS